MSILLFPKMKRFFSLFLASLLTVCLPAASSAALSRFIVLPVGSLQFSMSDMEYVGNRVPVVMDKLFNSDGNDGNTITWSAQKDSAACIIDLSNMGNDGGTVIYPEPGEYTLTVTLRDRNGKTATASQSITIVFKVRQSFGGTGRPQSGSTL